MPGIRFIISLLLIVPSFAKANGDSLFAKQTTQDIALTLSIKEVARTKKDTVYGAHTLGYRNQNNAWDSIEVGLKARGNFRLQQCYFPPLTIRIKAKKAKGTLFEGNKKLKLVLPCNNAGDGNDLVVKEYLCYKLYEAFTPYAFKTRLVNIDLTELRKGKTRTYKLKGILIEDVDKTAKRFNATAVENVRVGIMMLDDTTSLQFDFFQYMIANTDWSQSSQHNSKIIYRQPNYIPLPYDFDLCGIVDAPYAFVSITAGGDELPIENVRQRYYRGHCRSKEATAFVRQQYLSKETVLLSVPDVLKGELPDKQIEEIKDYLKQFFEILKDDYSFENYIVGMCRNN